MTNCFGDPNMVRKPRPGEWSEEETEKLRQYAREGLTQREAAERLGCNVRSVENRSRRAKIRWSGAKQPWAESEVAILRKLAPSHTGASVAAALGRTTGSVERKALGLGVSFAKHGEALPWTKLGNDGIRQIFELRQEGLYEREIALRVGCSRSHVGTVLNLRSRWRESLPMLLEQVG